MKFLKWMFGFGKKYRKREEEYARKSRKFGTSGELVFLFILALIPLISLWGLFYPTSTPILVLSIFGTLIIFYAPKELLIIGIVALRHSARMKIENKITGKLIGKTAEVISGQELNETQKEDLDNYKARGTAHKYDIAVGICGIVLSVLVVVAFVTMLFLLLTGVFKGLL